MRALYGAILLAASLPSALSAQIVAQNQSSDDLAYLGNYYLGQSFTVLGTGTFDSVVANFYGQAGAAAAPGTLFLYSTELTGIPSSAAPGFLGSVAGSGGVYTFDPTVLLTGGTQYFAYSNAQSPVLQYSYSSLNPYAGGNIYQATGAPFPYNSFGHADLRFQVTARQITAGVPEPATWAMMMLGFGALGGAMRYRRRKLNVSYGTA